MKILHHERKRLASHFSIERLFAEIRRQMPADCEVVSCPAPEASAGILPRWRNVRQAARQTADVHHIVGDSHYLAFGLPREKTVLTIHDCGALNRLSGWKRALLKYFWFTGPMRRAAVVTTISQASKDELRKWVGPLADKVVVVPDCVFADFAYAPKPFNEECPVVLQVGTKWNKNVERVMEAVRGIGCRLEIVGTISADRHTADGIRHEAGGGNRETGDGGQGTENMRHAADGERHEASSGQQDDKTRGQRAEDGLRLTDLKLKDSGRTGDSGQAAGSGGQEEGVCPRSACAELTLSRRLGSVGRCFGVSEETRHEEEWPQRGTRDAKEEDLRLTDLKLKDSGMTGDGGQETVKVLGRLTDLELVEAYRRCDMVVFTSLYEGFGLPILEAQAMGRPVITSNFGAMREAAGDGALLVDPYSVEAIREAILRVKNEPGLREELIAKGLRNAAKFSADAVASKYAEIYRGITAKRHKS